MFHCHWYCTASVSNQGLRLASCALRDVIKQLSYKYHDSEQVPEKCSGNHDEHDPVQTQHYLQTLILMR